MENGLGVPQSIVLFGATSDIGSAIIDELVRTGVSSVVLCARDPQGVQDYADRLRSRVSGLRVLCKEFDGANPASFAKLIREICNEVGDIDVAVVAHGLLGDEEKFAIDPASAVDTLNVNFTGTVVLTMEIAKQFRSQNHGRLVVLSSVAGQRVRKSLSVYGASKAGLDQFLIALDHDLSVSGASVLVVRPGFVATKMTAGQEKAPFSTTPEKVAEAVKRALEKDKNIVWCPSVLRYVFGVMRLLPEALWRKVVEKQG